MNVFAFPRTSQVDRVVIDSARTVLARLPCRSALLAVGGYGRRELFPFSDVDLLLLLAREPDDDVKEPLSDFLRTLWDSSVKASHSVRTVDECCRVHDNNIHLSISLLDARFLTGTSELFEELNMRLADFFRHHARPLLRGLADLTSARHAKFDATVYHLEPNIKEGPGGIRDIHFVEWAAKLAPDKEPLRHAVETLSAARDFLYRLRYFLHENAGRDNNVLNFELQDRAAATLLENPLSPEEWMRLVYRHLRTCFQASQQVLDFVGRGEAGLARQFREWRSRFSTADYTIAHNRIYLRNPTATLSSLASIFDLFRYVARQGIRLSWDTQRRIRERIDALAATPRPRWSEWRALLSEPQSSLALREMEDAGVLSLALPAWKAIESLVVRDFYHRYTVDEHTLVAIGAIDHLVSNAGGAPQRLRDLAKEEDQLALLRMALLLHDFGKGTTPGDHVRGSLDTAAQFLSELGASETDRQSIAFLIAHHLDLSVVMNGRDLSDPATARFLSSQIGTYEDLRRLTLLTYADISAVHPGAMSPWRAEQLWRVHSVAAEQLTRELSSDRIHAGAGPAQLRPELAEFLEGFPARYLRIHSPPRIEEHFRLEKIRRHENVALDITAEPGAYVLTVLAADHPGLFASLCGTLASFGMNIVKAEAASNATGCVLDEFHFTDPARTLELNPEEMERLRWTIECVVKGALEVRDLLKRRRTAPRPHASSQIASIRFDDAASDSATLLNFATNDRPGLLFDLARVLTETGCNIEVVLVNTEGHRALDALYITKNGHKLDAATEAELKPLLAAL